MKITAIALLTLTLSAAICHAQAHSSTGNGSDFRPASANSAATPSTIDPAKEADIRQLLKIMGAGDLAMQVMGQLEKNMKPLITKSLPPGDYREKLVDLFMQKFQSKIDSGKMVDLVVPVYDKYLDDGEVKSLTQLYQTPIGQRLLSVMPKITAESQAAGEQWGRELGRESMVEVLGEHPDLEKALEQATRNAQAQQP